MNSLGSIECQKRAESVRAMRAELGLTQEGLAARLDIRRETVARWETCVIWVSDSRLNHIKMLVKDSSDKE